MATLIQLPASFPGWDAGAQVQPVDLFASVATSTGASRRRRVYRNTTSPRDINVAANMTGAQMVAFDEWFENSIKAGALRFLAFVGWPVGGNPAGQWYEATFAEPVNTIAQTGGYWTMTAKLRLHGTGAPATPALSMAVISGLQASCDASQPLVLSMSVLAGLVSSVA